MISATIYAQSFYEIAKEKGCESFLKEWIIFKELLEQNPKLNDILQSYLISFEEKDALIDQIFKSYFHKNIVNGIKLIVEKRDFNKMVAIIEKTINLLHQHLNISSGIIYSPKPIKSSQIKEITSLMTKKIKKKVVLENHIDQELLGGVKIILNQKIYDHTINYHLKQLYSEIKERMEK